MTTLSEPQRLQEAIRLSILAHGTYTDKQGEMYLLHVFRVMLQFPHDIPRQILGVLHDTGEDSWMRYDTMEAAFGTDIADAWYVLQRREDQTYEQYIYVVKGNALARPVKIADLRDNLARMIPELESLRPRYTKALAMLEDKEVA